MKARFLSIFSGFALASFLIGSSALASTYFSRNLSIGMSGSDVVLLQKVLNSTTTTEVASSGVGSPGQESSYFGAKTQNAVIRFQNLYANDILVPAGLASGNGFVGQLTRNKLDSLLLGSSVQNNPLNQFQSSPSQATTSQPAASSTQVAVFSTNPHFVAPGVAMTITGINFTAQNNTLYLNSQSFPGLVSTTTNTLSFTLPATIVPNRYTVRVVNSNGDSATILKSQVEIVVLPSLKNQTAPGANIVISSSTPSKPSLGAIVTLIGKGFASSGNTIVTPFGTTTATVVDAQTLSFKLSNIQALANFQNIPNSSGTARTLPLPVFVVNSSGTSNGFVVNVQF